MASNGHVTGRCLIKISPGQLALCMYFECEWPLYNWGEDVLAEYFNCTGPCSQFIIGAVCVRRGTEYSCVCDGTEQSFFRRCVPEIFCRFHLILA